MIASKGMINMTKECDEMFLLTENHVDKVLTTFMSFVDEKNPASNRGAPKIK